VSAAAQGRARLGWRITRHPATLTPRLCIHSPSRAPRAPGCLCTTTVAPHPYCLPPVPQSSSDIFSLLTHTCFLSPSWLRPPLGRPSMLPSLRAARPPLHPALSHMVQLVARRRR
jgi:hypothetical protein